MTDRPIDPNAAISPARTSYAAMMKEAVIYAEMLAAYCDECDDDSCERCTVIVTHIAALRSLAALVEKAEQMAVRHDEGMLTKGGERFALSEIALTLAAGFTVDPPGTEQ